MFVFNKNIPDFYEIESYLTEQGLYCRIIFYREKDKKSILFNFDLRLRDKEFLKFKKVLKKILNQNYITFIRNENLIEVLF